MTQKRTRIIVVGTIAAALAVLGTESCAHPATDRVLEPVGGPNASPTTPSSPLADAAAPIVRRPDPERDFTLIRAPELGRLR